jgi:threonine dehydrogenase-like Zn-dependent dehydrogenase
MLRLWVVGAAIWMGCVLVMTAVRNAGRHPGGAWLVAGAGIAALVLVVGADVVNPEAFVVRHNLDRARHGAELDTGYLAELSDDAVPTIAGDRQVSWLLTCSGDREGVAALNRSAAQATDSRQEVCDDDG